MRTSRLGLCVLACPARFVPAVRRATAAGRPTVGAPAGRQGCELFRAGSSPVSGAVESVDHSQAGRLAERPCTAARSRGRAGPDAGLQPPRRSPARAHFEHCHPLRRSDPCRGGCRLPLFGYRGCRPRPWAYRPEEPRAAGMNSGAASAVRPADALLAAISPPTPPGVYRCTHQSNSLLRMRLTGEVPPTVVRSAADLHQCGTRVGAIPCCSQGLALGA